MTHLTPLQELLDTIECGEAHDTNAEHIAAIKQATKAVLKAMRKIPTPRTDAEEIRFNHVDCFDDKHSIPAEFARQLERELAEAKDTLDNALVDHDRLQQENYALEKRLTEAKTYKDAIDSNLICAHLGVANGKPKEELQALINWEIGVHEFFEVDKLKQELAISQAREVQLRERLGNYECECDDSTGHICSSCAGLSLPPPPGISLAEVIDILTDMAEMPHHDQDDEHRLRHKAKRALESIKSKHPELI